MGVELLFNFTMAKHPVGHSYHDSGGISNYALGASMSAACGMFMLPMDFIRCLLI
jgi:hypothetical protein